MTLQFSVTVKPAPSSRPPPSWPIAQTPIVRPPIARTLSLGPRRARIPIALALGPHSARLPLLRPRIARTPMQRCSDPVAPTPSLGPRRSNPFARTHSLGLPSPAHPSLGLPSLGPTSFRTHRSAPTASPPCSLHGRLPLALLGPRRSDPVAWTHGNCSDLVACACACCRPLAP